MRFGKSRWPGYGWIRLFAAADFPPSVIALSKLYALNDARLSQMMVRGDLIVPEDDIIITRSRSKQSKFLAPTLPCTRADDGSGPDQYTIVPASLKILKVLIQEIVSASGTRSAAGVAAGLARAAADLDEDDGDDTWEDDPDAVDLGLGFGASKEQLLALGMDTGPNREQDDETLAYLTEFFVVAGRDNVANFVEWYKMMTDEERQKLAQLTNN
jgi:importin-9